MDMTADLQAKFPNATQACFDFVDSGLKCVTGFGPRIGNGFCSDHALDAIRDAVK